MNITILLIFSLILLFFIFSNKTEKFNSDNPAVIPLKLYPELKLLEQNKNIIHSELEGIINKKVWILFKKLQEIKIISQNYNQKQINELNDNMAKHLNSTGKPEWFVFMLIYNNMPLEKANELFPKTMEILRNVPGVLAAGISCLEGDGFIEPHSDAGIDRYRFHLPLIIPEKCGIKINNVDYIFDKPFLFDDTYEHSVWNFSKTPRFVLCVDIKRK